MKKLYWIGFVGALALSGCMSPVEREAVSFPDMPNMPVYHRVDNRQLPPDQTLDMLQTAMRTCQTPSAGGAASALAVGSAAFDSCMQGQGYRRVQ